MTFSPASPAQRPAKRSWKAAREKVDQEGACRNCGRSAEAYPIDAAHIVPRSRIPGHMAMDPLNILPLCRLCHGAQHRDELEVLPLLSLAEQSYVVGLVGIAEAYRRTTVPGRVTGKAA